MLKKKGSLKGVRGGPGELEWIGVKKNVIYRREQEELQGKTFIEPWQRAKEAVYNLAVGKNYGRREAVTQGKKREKLDFNARIKEIFGGGSKWHRKLKGMGREESTYH